MGTLSPTHSFTSAGQELSSSLHIVVCGMKTRVADWVTVCHLAVPWVPFPLTRAVTGTTFIPSNAVAIQL